MSAEVLELLPGNGGVNQLAFVPYFASADVAARGRALQDERARLGLPAVTWNGRAHHAPARIRRRSPRSMRRPSARRSTTG
ncbi:hypothetical protein [Streptomyces sp. NPDC002763]|uniref:hypothetical protein n=1 Tax=Streptomyces sp. NPDC002763 TaxID=3154427 RepID=UPI00331B6C7E